MSGLVPLNRKITNTLSTGFEDFYNMLDDFFSENLVSKRNLEKDTFKVDVEEKENEYLVEAALPGVKKEELKVDLNEGTLNISVKREAKIDEEKKNYIHKERSYSSMSRSFYLDGAADDGIKAKLENGVLNITVPKTAKKEKAKVINIE